MQIFLNKLKLIILLMLFLLGSVCFSLEDAHAKLTQPYTELMNNPQLLDNSLFSRRHILGFALKNCTINNAQWKDLELDDLQLENVTFKNVSFEHVIARRFTFKNVVFENCIFDDSSFMLGEFHTVYFKGGKFFSRNKKDYSDIMLPFDEVLVFDVVIDGSAFTKVKFYVSSDENNGRLLVKNITTFQNSEFDIGSAKARFENCIIDSTNEPTLNYSEGGVLHIKNSTVAGHSYGKDGTVYVENCTFSSLGLGWAGLAVVKNSSGNFMTRGNEAYIINHSLKDTEIYNLCGFTAAKNYILGGKVGIALFPESESYVTAQNATVWLEVRNAPQSHLYLKDCTIVDAKFKNIFKEYYDGKQLEIFGDGKWENVTIASPISVDHGKVGGLLLHNVTPPAGKDLKSMFNTDNAEVDFAENPTPFQWDQIKEPSTEELGLNWKITPATGHNK